MDVQRNLEANVEKRTKDTYGPPIGEYLLYVYIGTHNKQDNVFHQVHCIIGNYDCIKYMYPRQEAAGVC